MKKVLSNPFRTTTSLVGFCLALTLLPACQKFKDFWPHHDHDDKPKTIPGNFRQFNLVANSAVYNATRIDSVLLNGWGISWSATGTPWIGSQGGHVSTVYNSEGGQQLAPVKIPSPAGPTGGNPTGTVFNGVASDFILSNGQAARFMFVGLDGILSGWNGAAGSNALLIKNNAGNAIYTGMAIASDGGAQFIYATNAQKGTIDVWDRTFTLVPAKTFTDPYLPSGYVPYNIQAVGDKLYVTYTKIAPDGRAKREVGNGIVNIFTTAGVLVKRFAAGGTLNAPWGVAVAPASFFPESTEASILIGNFGDGKINAYAADGKFIGQLKVNNKVVAIDGLWAISFAPSTSTIDPNRLYFAAGPRDEKDGLFGYLLK
jgi:uncharacterized protein (TIGR03118 family)